MATSFMPIQRGHFTLAKKATLGLPKILLLDMNSFFASVEQQANPFLRGRSVGVVASMHPTSCLIAASKEAKKRGIKTGTLIHLARQICPELILIKSEPEKYREVSRGFNRILADYSDRLEQYSIDETFVDLRGLDCNPLAVGAEIKRRIKAEVGEWLTCSIGLGDNKFLAKTAAELKKNDGLSVIWREHLAAVYQGLKFSDLWGLNRGWTRRLQAMNILTPVQMLDYPVQNLISVYGKPGFYIWRRVNGLEEDVIGSEEDAPKSFGHSWVLNFRSTDKGRLAPVIWRLAEKAARRMRREGYAACGMYLSLSCRDGGGLHLHKTLGFPIDRGSQFYDQAMLLWRSWQPSSAVNQVAVGFTRLKADYKQLSLFDDKDPALTKAIDDINNKYGEFTIRSGLITHSRDFAPDAIAFGK
jgi:DNA polymerase-4